MKRFGFFLAFMVGGCVDSRTPEGCPVMLSSAGSAYTEACIAEFHAEKARAAGGVVTTCRPAGGAVSCVTY